MVDVSLKVIKSLVFFPVGKQQTNDNKKPNKQKT